LENPQGSVIDSHCHVVREYFAHDQAEVIERALSSGVKYLVNPGCSLADAEEVLELTRLYKPLYGGVGIHPHEAKTWDAGSEAKIKHYAGQEKIVGIGECGLDYYYNHSEPETQRTVFAHHVRIARELNLPVIVHCRDAWDECMDIIEEAGKNEVDGVFHCFTGGPELLPRIARLGFYMSFSGIVTFKKSEAIQEAARLAPSDKILVETDCPYLAPQKVRGKRNEPAYVWMVAEKVAELRGISLKEVADFSAQNTCRLFKLPES
jgi:TatD DNase family protein